MKLEFSEGYATGFQTKKNFHERIWILILLKQHEKVEGHGSDGKLRVWAFQKSEAQGVDTSGKPYVVCDLNLIQSIF